MGSLLSCLPCGKEESGSGGGGYRARKIGYRAEDDHAASDDEDTSGDAYINDEGNKDALSHVANAARKILKDKHWTHRKKAWNLSYGTAVGKIWQSPPGKTWGVDYHQEDFRLGEKGHSHKFPEKMYEVMCKAEEWLDVTSLTPPDGRFLEKFVEAIKVLDKKNKTITVRMLFGNIIGMPADCEGFLRSLHKDLNKDTTKLRIWIGSWRKDVSWNHSKIIAADGKYLFHGGHNLWDPHYLQNDPVHDLSMESEGPIAQDGHSFANRMWHFVDKTDERYMLIKHLPDWMPLLVRERVCVAQWPKYLHVYPPQYERPREGLLPLSEAVQLDNANSVTGKNYPIISMGRYGSLHEKASQANPSDSAIVAMIDSAQKYIRMSLQDLGPLTMPVPGKKSLTAIPGGVWPAAYLRALGLALVRGVHIEIIVSNPFACPGSLNPLTANYGNGWTCQNVCSEIIGALIKARPTAKDNGNELRSLIKSHLQVSTISVVGNKTTWDSGATLGNHAKFFMVDDQAYYIGSQNLYIANLAEWGVIIDCAQQCEVVKEQYWNPMWENSWMQTEEVDLDEIMNGLKVNRDGIDPETATPEQKTEMLKAQRQHGFGSDLHLVVVAKSATNVRNADIVGSSDSYCQLWIVDKKGKTICRPQLTKVIENGGPSPEWDEKLYFEGLDNPLDYTLKIGVYDQDKLFGFSGGMADMLCPDDKLGACDCPLGDLVNKKGHQNRELVIAPGKSGAEDSKILITLNTNGGWGC